PLARQRSLAMSALSPRLTRCGQAGSKSRSAASCHLAAMYCVTNRICDATPSGPRRRSLSSVNLSTNKRNSALIDRSSVPCLNRSELGFAGLVSRARAPAVGPEEICRRGQRVGRSVETSAGAVVQDALGQELCMADLAVHGATRPCREDAAINQCKGCVELLSEKSRPAAVIGESSHRRQSVLVAA